MRGTGVPNALGALQRQVVVRLLQVACGLELHGGQQCVERHAATLLHDQRAGQRQRDLESIQMKSLPE